MLQYAILNNPGHNRIYYEESKKFAVSELEIVGKKLSITISDIKHQDIAGVSYIVFKSDKELSDKDIFILSRLSFMFALFKIEENPNMVMYPTTLPDSRYINSNINTILKYTGKTNEIFTQLAINIAVYSSEFYNLESINLLDPVAGKGTTLFEGLKCGYNSYGIEIGGSAVLESYQFLKKYLETEQYKHSTKIEKINGSNKPDSAKRYRFELAPSKEDIKNNNTRIIEFISGSSAYADGYFKKNSFHIIVGDLPYGVKHGSVTKEKQSSITRNPKGLLSACLSAWREVLKPGGTVVLAWNTFLLSREEMTEILKNNGFKVIEGKPYDTFLHRVDQSIKRDIIAAQK